MDEELTEEEEAQFWLDFSAEVLHYIREHDLLVVPEKKVWLVKPNTLDQLAAFLQTYLQEDPDGLS